jgi:hypothetical protein
MKSILRNAATVFAVLALTLTFAAPASAANVVIFNLDVGTGLGYDDPTPAQPQGGNPGTTLGELRLNAANHAAEIWGAALDSDATVFVLATFQPLSCTPTSGTLGSAGTTFVFRDFVGAEFPGTWYHSALADALAGEDLNPGFGDIFSQFNGLIGVDPNCLTGSAWYYGYDNNEAANEIDFLSVVLHEIGHGLGFANFANEATGTLFNGLPDIYTVYSLDNTLGKTWNVMTDAERAFSGVNDGNVVWNGPETTARTSRFLSAQPEAAVAGVGTFAVQGASFGPAVTPGGVSGTVVLAEDGVGASNDGCEAITNNVAGAIALIDRGVCGFTVKALNAQAAGAIGVIIANNAPGGPAPMGGADPNVNIVSVGITQAQGNAIKAALPTTATIRLSATLLAGADAQGQARLYMPTVVRPGSSGSHFDVALAPNALMEPFINADLESNTTLDLSPFVLLDEGWTLLDADGDNVFDVEDSCADSLTDATVTIDGCNSGVANQIFANGCSIADLVMQCADGAGNHGAFVSCSAKTLNALKKAGVITDAGKGAIQSCSAGANLP